MVLVVDCVVAAAQALAITWRAKPRSRQQQLHQSRSKSAPNPIRGCGWVDYRDLDAQSSLQQRPRAEEL